jgi:hypothetical protein
MSHRSKFYLLAAMLWFSAAPAVGQSYYPAVSPGNVVGNLNLGPGAAYEIPLNQLAAALMNPANGGLVGSGTVAQVLQANPSDPTGTASVTGVMMGLGGTCKLTPAYSSRARFEIIGSIANSSANAGTQPELVYGSGAAPANGDAPKGTVLGKRVDWNPGNPNNNVPFALSGIATGLTAGTALWFDVNLLVGTGTGTLTSLSCNAMEF